MRGMIYAAARGREIGLFDWEVVQPLVDGVSDAIHRNFYNMEEAKEWIQM